VIVRACYIQSDSPLTHVTPPTRSRYQIESQRCPVSSPRERKGLYTASTTELACFSRKRGESGGEVTRFAAKTLGTALGSQTMSCACSKAKGGQRFVIRGVKWSLYL
jgi:hypothetical protein